MMIVCYILIFALFPFLFTGIINRVKAKMAGRKGQPLVQPFFDFVKLLRKGEVTSTSITFLFYAYPAVALAGVFFAGLFVPMPDGRSVLSFEGDFILFSYTLGLTKLFAILSALDTGSSFEGMGASREAHFSVFAEPAFFIMIGTLSLLSGHTRFESIVKIGAIHPIVSPLLIVLVSISLFLLVLVEGCRVPVDDPATHLELTMIHEVMILDNSGPGLALTGFAASVKTVILSSVIASVGSSVCDSPALSALIYFAILLLTPFSIGIVESTIARMRMSHVPQFILLIASISVIALLAAVFSITGGLI